MSEIQRLLRVAARRNEASEYGSLRLRLLKAQIAALKEKLKADSMSATVLIEAVIKGYLDSHPAVLAMIDQWRRDNQKETGVKAVSLSDRELADIYAEIGSGNMEE